MRRFSLPFSSVLSTYRHVRAAVPRRLVGQEGQRQGRIIVRRHDTLQALGHRGSTRRPQPQTGRLSGEEMKALASDAASTYLSPLRVRQGDGRPTKRIRTAFNWVFRNVADCSQLGVQECSCRAGAVNLSEDQGRS